MTTINLKQAGDGSAGLEGYDKDAGAFIFVNIPYTTTTPLTLYGAILPRQCVVKSVTLRTDVSATNAVTATAYQVPSGTDIGAGTALTGTMSLQNTIDTNLAGTLSTTAGALIVPAGSSIGVVVSGAIGASGAGIITIGLNPA